MIVCSEEKYRIQFTSDEYDVYFFTVANGSCFDILRLDFFPKTSGMHRSYLTLRYGYILLFVDANSVDPYQTPRFAASDRCLLCLPISLYKTLSINGLI